MEATPRLNSRFWPGAGVLLATLVAGAALVAGASAARAEDPAPAPTQTTAAPPASAPADTSGKFKPEELESLVAPIALYPDDLLAQTLAASTYPLEIVQLQQYLQKHPDLKDKQLADSVATQPWDPSIQSMAAIPDVVKRLAEDIQWTTDLGNAFLAQQDEVMDAVQVMRKKAKDNGALESSEQQKVETKVVESKQVIIVESSNPEVIYVPSYSPTYVYGPPPYAYYPYPPIYYPPYTPGAAFVSFSFGVMWGAAVWGGSCCGCGWGGHGHNTVVINNNNNFNQINNRNTNINSGNRGSGNWSHNAEHRGGAPYGDKGTADRYGGATASDRSANRGQTKPGGAGAGVSDRASGTGQRGAGVSDRSAGAGQSNRAGTSDRSASAGQSNRSGASDRSASAGQSNRAGSSDRIGSRDIPKQSSSGRSSSGFSGGSGGYDRGSAKASQSRGSSSMGSRGGGSRGGGGRGGRR